ncbi:hypothetical protein NDN08_004576 [Rhodosorus marinus]|uniref:DUF4131 domain-containing protein n=1 Tax=Rhodosorus marinus TaxID=101924 RepID=A0AAV8ULN3_9RHOD|nr:hypothetical protein NDN08_004576 [Rhodosorus marinus]
MEPGLRSIIVFSLGLCIIVACISDHRLELLQPYFLTKPLGCGQAVIGLARFLVATSVVVTFAGWVAKREVMSPSAAWWLKVIEGKKVIDVEIELQDGESAEPVFYEVQAPAEHSGRLFGVAGALYLPVDPERYTEGGIHRSRRSGHFGRNMYPGRCLHQTDFGRASLSELSEGLSAPGVYIEKAGRRICQLVTAASS